MNLPANFRWRVSTSFFDSPHLPLRVAHDPTPKRGSRHGEAEPFPSLVGPFHRLDDAIDLEGLVGRQSSEILRGGYKIELEGATNPHIYPPGHIRWIVRYLRTMMRRAAGDGVSRRRRSKRAT